MRRLLLPALLTVTALGIAQQIKLTPRDAFWSASDLVGNVSANPAAHKAVRHAPRPEHTPRPTAAAPSQAAAATPMHVSAETVSAEGYGAQPHFVEASLHVHQLGMRYSLLLRNDDDTYHEVSPTAVFHSGDHLRLSVMANEPSYLYVIEKGSSGAWNPLFPAPNFAAGSNHVDAGRPYLIPGPPMAFRFDQTPGSENLYVLLSRQPIADLQAAIGNLRGSQPSAMPDTSTVAPPPVDIAENRIPNELVEHLVGRDLTLVDEQQVNQPANSEATGEKAVYVVAKAGAGTDAQLVAHIVLKHE